METITPIERIHAQARAAALEYSDINDACPWPFHSDNGHAFKAEFRRERARIEGRAATDAREAPCAG